MNIHSCVFVHSLWSKPPILTTFVVSLELEKTRLCKYVLLGELVVKIETVTMSAFGLKHLLNGKPRPEYFSVVKLGLTNLEYWYSFTAFVRNSILELKLLRPLPQPQPFLQIQPFLPSLLLLLQLYVQHLENTLIHAAGFHSHYSSRSRLHHLYRNPQLLA